MHQIKFRLGYAIHVNLLRNVLLHVHYPDSMNVHVHPLVLFALTNFICCWFCPSSFGNMPFLCRMESQLFFIIAIGGVLFSLQ